MRRFAFLAPLAAVLALASGVVAQTADHQGAGPTVNVTLGPKLQDQVETLGQRDVDLQVERLTHLVQRELTRNGTLEGARLNLVLTDLQPNRPTFQQAIDRPGLSIIDSVSIGGAAIEGELITAQGERLPVKYSRYSSNISEVFGYNTWEDADRAFTGLASNLSRGRLVSR